MRFKSKWPKLGIIKPSVLVKEDDILEPIKDSDTENTKIQIEIMMQVFLIIKLHRPSVVSRYRSVSLSMSWI